jgi:hypothetical protein
VPRQKAATTYQVQGCYGLGGAGLANVVGIGIDTTSAGGLRRLHCPPATRPPPAFRLARPARPGAPRRLRNMSSHPPPCCLPPPFHAEHAPQHMSRCRCASCSCCCRVRSSNRRLATLLQHTHRIAAAGQTTRSPPPPPVPAAQQSAVSERCCCAPRAAWAGVPC